MAFRTIGASYSSPSGASARVRTRSAAGWGPWQDLLVPSISDGPDIDTVEGRHALRAATDPAFVPASSAYEISLPADATDASIHLVHDIIGRPAAPTSSAATSTSALAGPTIHSRAEWGARAAKIHPGIADASKGVQFVVVHHTASDNSYVAEDVPAILRGMQAYDMDARDYDDIGYNIVVDKFGRAWEGRTGGIDQPVIGAQALGYNRVSTGISLLGNFVDVQPSQAALDMIGDLAGWKLAMEGLDPRTTVDLTHDDTEGNPAFPTPRTIPRIVGHKDIGQTLCPGHIYDHLDVIRTRAATWLRRTAGTVAPVVDNGNRTVSITGTVSLAPVSTGDAAEVAAVSTPATVIVSIDRSLTTPTIVSAPAAGFSSAATTQPTFGYISEPLLPGPHKTCVFTGDRSLVGCQTFTVVDPAFDAVRPKRLLDTRTDDVPLLPDESRVLAIAGHGDIPAATSAVVLNVTATAPSGEGFLTLYPCGGAKPSTTSNLNFDGGATVANLVVSKVGAGGTVCLFSNQRVHVVVDITAWYPAGAPYHPVEPQRLLDTRDSRGRSIDPLRPYAEHRLHVGGVGSIADDAASATLNVTAVNATADGFGTVYPCGTASPGTSSLNFTSGHTIANLVITKLGTGGDICFFSKAVTDIVIDISGWSPVASTFHAIVPERLMDTRIKLGASRLGSDDVVELKVHGTAGIPVTATAVAVNVAVTDPSGAGYISVYPCSQVWPGTSNLNYGAGQTIANMTVTRVGIGGCLRITSMSSTDIVADVTGWFD